MRKLFQSFLVLIVFGVGVAGAFVSENAWEMQSEGDFNGDARRDLIIVDKATGNYRLGYRQAAGNFVWASTRASGIAPATGLGIGKLNSLTFDSLALTGPTANRVNVFDANNTGAAGLPVSFYPPSLGPNLVVAIDIGGAGTNAYDDFYVASEFNGTSAFRETLVRNPGTTNRTTLVDSLIYYQRERGNPVLLHTNRPPRLGVFERNVGVGYDIFSFYDLAGGTAVYVTAVATSRSPQPYEFVSGQLIGTNPYTQVLFYPPTGYYFYEYQVSEPSSGVYALTYTNSFVLTNYIDRLFLLNGAGTNKLLILDTNGVTAVIYDFNGVTPPVTVQSLTAAAGEHFTGAGVLGDGGFVAYSAPIGQNLSSRFNHWQWNGSAFTNRGSGDLPRISSYSGSGNVMQFQFEPFVTNNPVLLRMNNAGDWSGSPAYSASPGNISVKTEMFFSSTQGLVNPTPVVLGAAHPLAAFGLANQYSNMISLFSFTPPAGDKISDVTISPSPGLYATAVQLKFTAANTSDSIFFRAGSGAWITWSNGLVCYVFTNATIQYYGRPSGGGANSAIKSAGYTFTQGLSTLDSDDDGVPDYVEIARGLDPNGGRDSDGDGYSDLEELIHNTNPLSTNSVPTNWPHMDDRAVFNLKVKPYPWDGFSNVVSLCATGITLRAHDFQGSLLSVGTVVSNSWPLGCLSNITVVMENRLVVQATDLHYGILTSNADKTVGREMIGLTAVPPLTVPAVTNVYGGGTLAAEAQLWINSASNTLNNLPRATLTNNLTVNSTLTALLFELKTAQLLGSRSNLWWTNMTIFPFRVSDTGRTNPPQSLLLSLEQATNSFPAYKLQTVFAGISNQVENSVSSNITNLRAVTRDIYRINSLLNNANPATFVSPVDEIRWFLWHGGFDSNYLAWSATSNQFASATTGAIAILDSVAARPTTNVSLVVRLDTLVGSCRILDKAGGGATFALQDPTGLPFGFPNNFQLLPGSVVQVAGYTDVTNTACAYPAIEVTSVLLNTVLLATDADGNGNLLVDSWEKKFFGYVGVTSPFLDSDGDGYSDLQEMLDGSDPRDLYGIPTAPVANFQCPTLSLSASGGFVELHFLWPTAYIGKFNFGVRHTSDLGVPFVSLVATAPTHVAGDEFKMTSPVPGTSTHFYFLTVTMP
jgi:hypothetical protein